MFSRRRKNYRTFVICALIITLCVLIIALLWPQTPEEQVKEENMNVTVNTEPSIDNEDINKNQEDQELNEETSTPSAQTTYYIVKKNGDVISVYFVDGNGARVKLEDTDILYELLPVEDQEMFEKGIVIENQEKLASLLQDFEG